jgi:hypothetical protein
MAARHSDAVMRVDGQKASIVAVSLAFIAAAGCGSPSLTADGSGGAAGATAAAGFAGAAGQSSAAGAVGTDASDDDAPATGGGGTAGGLGGDAAGAAGASDADTSGADAAVDAETGGDADDASYDGPASNIINSSNWNETTIYPFATRRMLVRDEGNPSVALLDFGQTEPVVWKTNAEGPWARGLQLIGHNQVLGGSNVGYQVFDLTTGQIVKTVNGFINTQSAYRTASAETMLTRVGTILDFLDQNDQVTHSITYPGYGFVRLARPTRNGTFLVPSDTTLFEGDATGKVLWTAKGADWAHVYEPLLMSDGDVLLSTFFGSSLDVVDKSTHAVTTRYGTKMMTDAAKFVPNCFAGFQILPNGNFITANWEGHGAGYGATGIQIIEFDPAGEVVWYYKQDPAKLSSLQDVLVIDGMDPRYLHVQETSSDSTWQPVIPKP